MLAAAVDESRSHGKVNSCLVDVTDEVAVHRAAASTAQFLGRIDILVTSAGITGPNAKSWNYPVETWRRVIVNLNGLFYCCRAVIPFMIQQDYGRIVNIASIAGKKAAPMPPPIARRSPELLLLQNH